MFRRGTALALMLASLPVMADKLEDIEHVVIFMQENRSWDCVCIQSSMYR